MNRKELIEKYIEFFRSKGHKEIPNASLIPKDDPTVLFTTAGMHPLVPFLLGQPHPSGKRLVNVQKCIRTVDIEEVGDPYHHTFFEMFGNWSLGDYWKKEAIEFSSEFLTKILKIPKDRLAVTCFKGDKDAPKDTESAKAWKELGIPESRIAYLEKEYNWWGPAGKSGPCGPDTEMFYWSGDSRPPKIFDPKDKTRVEIGNDVFMEYLKDEKGQFRPAKQKNVDFGGGVERIISALNGLEDNYLNDCFKPIIEKIEELSKKKYNENPGVTKAMRIIADHIKASVFILSEGIFPGNTEHGYVLRRLIRRAVRYAMELKLKDSLSKIADPVFSIYDDYKDLQKNKNTIKAGLEKEEEKFKRTLEKGLNQFIKFTSQKKSLSGEQAFLLYQSYGFPIEMIEEESKRAGIKFSRRDFEAEQRKHQELSRTAAAGRFKSGLADSSEATTKLHTAAHLLLAALRKVLNDKDIMQRGSNITPERLRLDFSIPRKLTENEIKEIEELINKKIKESLPVKKEEMSLKEAIKKGALGAFQEKYGEKVFVYTIGPESAPFSREICAGPHVKNTAELGHFKILKEESSSSGVRRIKAVLE
jgi:alanyl-tRNA synthetase